jgi:integrase
VEGHREMGQADRQAQGEAQKEAEVKPVKYHLKDGSPRWKARWWDPNIQKVKSKGAFRTERPAKAYSARMATQIYEGTHIDPAKGKTTLAQWWAKYPDRACWIHLTPATQSLYAEVWRNLIHPHLGTRQLGTIRKSDVKAWVAKLMAAGKKEARISQAHRLLRKVLEEALEDELILSNPARGVKTGEAPKRERIFTPHEVNRMAEVVQPRYRAMILLMMRGGCRIGEAIALKKESLNPLKGTVTFSGGYTWVDGKLVKGKTKNKKSRTIRLPKSLVKELESHLEQFPPGEEDGLVFTTEKGLPIRRTNFRSQVWLPALEKAKISKPWPRVHDSKHTAVSLGHAAGLTIKELQALAGHSSPSITLNRYAHLFEGQDEAAAQRLDDHWAQELSSVCPQEDEGVSELKPRRAESGP